MGVILIGFAWLLALTLFQIYIYRQLIRSKSVHVDTDLLKSADWSKYFQYFSLVKFNPFADTGGEQSFIIALLDGRKSGFIITSLHGRGVTRFYAKNIATGISDQELSIEEKLALSQALHSKS